VNIGVVSNLLKENYINNNKILGTSLEKLSTGLRINKASDDASGLAISDKLRTQASGIKQGIDNANSALTMLNIADKSMSELSSILDTIKAKAIQINTDTTSNEGRKIIKTDILKLIDSYDNIVRSTNYNQTLLLNGSSTPFDFQVGDNSSEIIRVDVDSVESTQMGQADPYKLKNFITGFEVTTPIAPVTSSLFYSGGSNLNYNTTYNMDDFKNYFINQPNPTSPILDQDLISNAFSIGGFTPLLGLFDVSVTINANNFLTNGSSNPYSQFRSGAYFPKDAETKNYFDALSALDDTINGSSSTRVEHFVSPLLGDYYKIGGFPPVANGTVDPILTQEKILNFSVARYDDSYDIYNQNNIHMENVIIESLSATKSLPVYDSNYEITNFVADNSLLGFAVMNDGMYLSTSTPVPTPTPIYLRNDDNPDLKIQAQNLMKVIDESLNQLNSQRGNIGAGINQLESSAKNHMSNYVNIKNAESIIRDVDYASESSNFNKVNIIVQAGSYVQSQANEIDKQSITQLLK
jgi:flagellin